jgi:oxysterol-binding protein-related protein 9/10/11
MLVDLSNFLVVPKRVRPLEAQHAFESWKLWGSVTSKLMAKAEAAHEWHWGEEGTRRGVLARVKSQSQSFCGKMAEHRR